MAPVVELALVVEAHARLGPLEPVAQPEFVEVGEGGGVGRADEVVVALDLRAAEIHRGGHPADPVAGLEHGDVVATLDQLVGGGQAHGAGADDRDAPLHARSTA